MEKEFAATYSGLRHATAILLGGITQKTRGLGWKASRGEGASCYERTGAHPIWGSAEP